MKKIVHPWAFVPRFRRHAFGWRSQVPIQRIKEAVREIQRVARKQPVVAGEGAVLFLEKVAPAIEQVDSSSGAIGTAVNNAIAALVPVIREAPADDDLRDKWLNRLWQAVQDDQMPYLELLPEYWGELCGSRELASRWADEFAKTLRMVWTSSPPGGWFTGTDACLSALYRAERYDELLDLVKHAPRDRWDSRIWATRALAAQGKKGEAIAYAEATKDPYADFVSVAGVCEEILLADGKVEQAYSRYALRANRKGSNLATFRALASKYPQKEPAEILHDLAAHTPGEEGKWFATAKSIGLYDEAIALANRTPCDPKTLNRASRDMAQENPHFAVEAGMTSIRWLLAGCGYDIMAVDVSSAYHHTLKAAENAHCAPQTLARIRAQVENATAAGSFAAGILRSHLERDARLGNMQ